MGNSYHMIEHIYIYYIRNQFRKYEMAKKLTLRLYTAKKL